MKMNWINNKFQITALGLCVLLASCSTNNTGNSSDNEEQNVTVTGEETVEESKAQQVFYSMPSPFELASLLRNSGATFNKDILNSPDNLSKYISSSSKAVNLGIYGADLSYASIFGQTQSSMGYLTCIKGLTDDLGISSAFDKSSMDRLEKQKANDDSLQQIVAESYLIANSYLKNNERANVSTYILAGGLIEGLYIATSLIEEGNNSEDLYEMVAEQRFSLENLIAMLKEYKEQDAADLLKEFSDLLVVYNSNTTQNTSAKTEVHTSDNTSSTVIGGDDELEITQDQLVAISKKVSEIRTKLIN